MKGMNVSDSDIFGDWNVAHRNVHLQWLVAELGAPAWLVAVPCEVIACGWSSLVGAGAFGVVDPRWL